MTTRRQRLEQFLREVEAGDLIEFPRGIYSHWAVYIGNGEVIHLSGEGNDGLHSNAEHVFTIAGKTYDKAYVKKDNFFDVVEDSEPRINNSADKKYRPRTREEIVKVARSLLGKRGYNLIWDNCEHFAHDCRYGKPVSKQADIGLAVAKMTGGPFVASAISVAQGKGVDEILPYFVNSTVAGAVECIKKINE